ncbi:MAG: hypothetical protein Ta2D_12060 [Rickettsiales bacterium]|nr:MAG: hypothetical protein Ta2D_12060 [Rickettsiales bacterium]
MRKVINWLNSLVTDGWLWLWFFVSFINGIMANMSAESVMHQIYAELQILEACIILCALYIKNNKEGK